jgi:type I restriction enzyme M protein
LPILAQKLSRIGDWGGSNLDANFLQSGSVLDAIQHIAGFCRSVPLAEIAQHGHVLTPGRYVGSEEVEDDDEAFSDKMQTLTAKLGEQMAKGAELDALIRQKLGGLGYEF